MKNYHVSTNNPAQLRQALERMTEYATFLAEDDGYRPRIEHIHEILKDEGIEYHEEELPDYSEDDAPP